MSEPTDSVRRAMLLAAGRGERMRPLTDHTPKALLPVRGRPLIVHHLEKLGALGVREVVINLAWLGAQIRAALGDGSRWGVRLTYSDEGNEALETGGGIVRALPWLGEEPFLVVNADVFTDFDFAALDLVPEALAQLLLVPNPEYHPRGDFILRGEQVGERGERGEHDGNTWTYAGIGLFRPELFAGATAGRLPLLPLLQRAIALGRLRGRVYRGPWSNVGTPGQLAALQ